MNKIFIEGVCGTGKSTMMRALAKELSAFTIPELPEFNRSLLRPFCSSDDIRHNFCDYITHEAIRESILLHLNTENIGYVLADRSYVSIVALALSMEDYVGKEFISSVISMIIKNIENGCYQIPDRIIVLCASYDNIYERNISKAKKMDAIWIDKERIKPQISFYQYLIDNSLAVSVSTNREFADSLDECRNECLYIPNSLDKEELVNGLRRYQYNYL